MTRVFRHAPRGGTGSAIARFQVLAAAILFSTGGAAVKVSDLDGWQVAGLRAGIAALFLLLAVPAARRGWNRRTVPVSLAFGAALLLFVLANKLTTAANTIFLVSTAPLYLVVLSPWLLKESMRRRDFVMLVLIAVGMAFFFLGVEPAQATAPDPVRGNWLAAAAGFAWALTVIGLRWLGRDVSDEAGDRRVADSSGREPGGRSLGAMPAVVLGNVIVFAVCLPRIAGLSGLSPRDGLVVSFLGIVQIGVAYIFLTAAMRRVPAIQASLLLMAEPVLSPVWAWLIHGEAVAGWALFGGGLILAAIALPGLYDALRRSESEVP